MERDFSSPQPGEYALYTIDYISLVLDGRLLTHLADGLQQIEAFVAALPPEKLTAPHAPGEWTVQDVLLHILDTERVFAYRALCLARGEQQALPGFEQDDYAALAGANAREITELLDEYRAVRAASVALLRSLPDEVLLRAGTASQNPLSVRAAAYIIAGHERYHLRSLRENYG